MFYSLSSVNDMRTVTALELLKCRSGCNRISFGCPVVDQCTLGGLTIQGITEIVGEGKTQCVLILSLQMKGS